MISTRASGLGLRQRAAGCRRPEKHQAMRWVVVRVVRVVKVVVLLFRFMAYPFDFSFRTPPHARERNRKRKITTFTTFTSRLTLLLQSFRAATTLSSGVKSAFA
jgi:hypothetical protein